MPFADTTWNRIIHTLFLTVVSNLVILIKASRNFFVKMILPDKDNFARSGMKT